MGRGRDEAEETLALVTVAEPPLAARAGACRWKATARTPPGGGVGPAKAFLGGPPISRAVRRSTSRTVPSKPPAARVRPCFRREGGGGGMAARTGKGRDWWMRTRQIKPGGRGRECCARVGGCLAFWWCFGKNCPNAAAVSLAVEVTVPSPWSSTIRPRNPDSKQERDECIQHNFVINQNDRVYYMVNEHR